MPAVGGLGENRPVKFQMFNHTLWGQWEEFSDNFTYFFLADFSSSAGVYENRDRLSYADGVGQLDFAGVGQAGSDDVFGYISCHIACGSVDFSGVFSAEAAATVSAFSAVGIDDDFSARDAAITFWAADYESACWVNVENDVLVNKSFWQGGEYNFINDLFP